MNRTSLLSNRFFGLLLKAQVSDTAALVFSLFYFPADLLIIAIKSLAKNGVSGAIGLASGSIHHSFKPRFSVFSWKCA